MNGARPESENGGPDPISDPISVAELLARSGTHGAPALTRRRRRRRGDSSVSVAELTGEIPVIRDDWSGAEEMSPDPLEDYAEIPVDDFLLDEPLVDEPLVHEPLVDETPADVPVSEIREPATAAREAQPTPSSRIADLWQAIVVVLQSILAVAFGAGLFIAFDQLWRWNSLMTLMLSVLIILGLVAGVRVVRRTEDIASTLYAVAVGALITLGPLALSLQTG